MALIRSVRGYTPTWGNDCWFADNATLVGEVVLGQRCTVWFNAVVRGDVHFIQVGDQTNIQDNVTIHGTYEKAPTTIGSYVTIAHNAIVHGCTLEDEVMIGMGAIVMDHAVVGRGAMIAAGAVVLEGTQVPPGSIYGGVPAKKLKQLDGNNLAMMKRIAANYVKYAGWFKEEK